jgi:segregation and condensation protein B
LAQLVGLLGLEAQQELDQIAARQHHLYLAEDASGPEPEEQADQPDGARDGEPDDAIVAETTAPASADGEPEAPAEAPAAAEPDGSEKRVARERERKLREFLRETVNALIHDYAIADRGIEVREVAGGFRMATKPEYHDAVRGFVKSLKPPLKLTLQALETLAVVAYKQPVTAPEISEIRGVDSGGVLGSLMARKLITTAGRKQVIGRPILYKTTKDFLLRFGLKDVGELPSIEEFEKMAGELAEQEEFPMPHGSDTAEERITHEDLAVEQHAHEPQADGNDSDLQRAEDSNPESNDSNLPGDELPAIDGRLSGLPPTYNKPGDDPSADEAAIQSGEGA